MRYLGFLMGVLICSLVCTEPVRNPFSFGEVTRPVVSSAPGVPVVRAVPATPLMLQGILISSHRYAIINNQVLEEGMLVLGWILKKIEKKEVILQKGDSYKTLRLPD